MRLGSHIALELVVGAILLGGVGAGALILVPSLAPGIPGADKLAVPPAHAAAPPLRPEPAPATSEPALTVVPPAAPAAVEAVELAASAASASGSAVASVSSVPSPVALVATERAPVPERAAAPAPMAGGRATVYGASDEELLAPLRGAAVIGTRINQGGTTLSLRVDFASGGRAAFKPDQVHPGSQPRREIAAFLVDRLLGIGRVPPAAAISVSLEQLIAASPVAVRGEVAARLRAEARPKRGELKGAASWWIPEIKVAAIGKHPIDSTDGIVTWKRYLTIGSKRPEEVVSLVAAISDMVLFDFLIDNSDRWSGGNARTSPDGQILYFMDNTMSFSNRRQGHTRTATYLRRVQQFSRRLVQEVRALTRERLVAALASADDAGLGPLLTSSELDAVMARHALAVEYLDALIAEHGEDAVLVFP